MTKKMKKKMKTKMPPSSPPSGWVGAATVGMTARREDGTGLAVMVNQVNGPGWVVVALESRASAGIDAVLDAHAHDLIGQFDTLVEALIRGEQYAAAWFARDERALARCKCQPIAVGATP